MDAIMQTTDTTAEDAQPMLTARESTPTPFVLTVAGETTYHTDRDAAVEHILSRIFAFTCEIGGVTTPHIEFADACKYVVDQLGPAHIVMRRDFGACRIGIWREEYDVSREPDAVITWIAGARV